MRARNGFIGLIVCTLSWGTIGVLVREVDSSSPVITFFRLIFGSAIVLAWLAVRGRLRLLRLTAHRALLIGSGIALGGHWALQFVSFKRLDVAGAILVVFIGPVLATAAAPFVLDERLEGRSVLALAMAFGGIGLITLPRIESIDGVGVLAALGSAVLFAVLMLAGKILIDTYEPTAVVVWQQSVATVALAPALLGASATTIASDLPELILLGTVLTGVLGIVFFHSLRALQAQQVSVLFYLEPASAVLYAWWLLAERPSATTLVGGALIVLAGVAIIRAERGRGAAAEPSTRRRR